MSFQNLPYDVVEVIAQYLSAKDILACSATCSSMRHMFNGDVIWKSKCDLEVINYLKENNTESFVGSSFHWFEIMDDELCPLTPLSTWRKYYMMQIRLYQNWKESKYKKKILTYGSYSGIFKFYQNEYLFLHAQKYSDEMVRNEVWDIKESRLIHSSFNFNFNDFFEDRKYKIKLYKIVDNKLIVSKENLVLIYEICLPSISPIQLVYAFIFNLSEDKSNSLTTRARAEPEFSLGIERVDQIVLCSNFLIGSIVNNKHTLHVWDILSHKKIAEENYSINSNVTKMILICHDEKNKSVILKLVLQGEEHRYHYKGYDLSKMEFSTFNVKHNYCDLLLFKNELLIGVDSHKLFLYDYKTSENLAVRRWNYPIMKETVTFVGDNLLCGTSDSTIFVMNSSLDIISSHTIHYSGCPLVVLRPIFNQFVILTVDDDTEVWEIGKTAKLLFMLPIGLTPIIVNQSCTKIAIIEYSSIVILNFW